MKNMKKILALALVIVSVLAISIPALAAVWSDRYGDIELYTNSGDNHDIMRMQTDLNTYFKNIPAYQLTVDGFESLLASSSSVVEATKAAYFSTEISIPLSRIASIKLILSSRDH